MTPAEVRKHTEAGIAAVLAAGPIALEYFRRPMTVTDKTPGHGYDPVTEADRRVELFLRKWLAAHCPGVPVRGEEFAPSGQGTSYWIIDPIDGTRSFISGMPTWGILLGLVVEGKAMTGIVHQPYTGETYLADPEHGARFRRGPLETRLETRRTATLQDAVLYSTHPQMLERALLGEQFRALTDKCRLQRWGGDCYAFALVAHGCIDLMVDAMLQPYDIVPLIPIIEGAGGVVTDLAGRSPLQGGTVIAAANAPLHAAALEIMNREPAAHPGAQKEGDRNGH